MHAAYTWAKVELLSGCWLEGGGVRWWGEVFPVGDFRCYTLLSGFTAYITSHTVDCSSPLCCCYTWLLFHLAAPPSAAPLVCCSTCLLLHFADLHVCYSSCLLHLSVSLVCCFTWLLNLSAATLVCYSSCLFLLSVSLVCCFTWLLNFSAAPLGCCSPCLLLHFAYLHVCYSSCYSTWLLHLAVPPLVTPPGCCSPF